MHGLESQAARLPQEMKTTDTNSGNILTLTDQQYFEERKLLLEARQRGYQRAEQMITGGVTGALVLSITFLRNLGSETGLLASEWLVGAWLLLLLTLFLSLLSNYTSAKSFDVEIPADGGAAAWRQAACESVGCIHSAVRPDHCYIVRLRDCRTRILCIRERTVSASAAGVENGRYAADKTSKAFDA